MSTITPIWLGPVVRQAIDQCAYTWAQLDALVDGKHEACGKPGQLGLYKRYERSAVAAGSTLCARVPGLTAMLLGEVWKRLHKAGNVTEASLMAELLRLQGGAK